MPVLILAVLVFVWIFNNGFSGHRSWQYKRVYEKMTGSLYNDASYDNTSGGKTPEETYDLFISALKDGDVELASSYFVTESQEGWFKILSEYKEIGTIDEFVKELEDVKKIWERADTGNDGSSIFEYEGQKIEFHKYPNGVWKIYVL